MTFCHTGYVGLHVFFAYFAAVKLGAALVPINFNLKAVEVDYILKHAETLCLFKGDFVSDLNSLDPPGYV